MGPPSYMRSVVDRNVVMRRIPLLQLHYFLDRGPGSSVGIATDYGLDGPGSNPGGEEISARPDRPWGPPSHL